MQEQIYQTQLRLQQSETGVSQKAKEGVMEKERQEKHYASSAQASSFLDNLGQNKQSEKSDASEERNPEASGSFAGLPASPKAGPNPEDTSQSTT